MTAASAPLISLAMIVRDDARGVARAIASAREAVDEVVVVDTGSVDDTREAAAGMGARVVRRTWRDDFAWARNQSLAQCAGLWCLVLDSDEELAPGGAEAVRRLAQEDARAGYRLWRRDFYRDGSSGLIRVLRLFRREGAVYHRAVHEVVELPGPLANAEVLILHHGYAAKDQARRRERQRRMVAAWLERDPGDWEAHCYWAQTLASDPATQGQAAGPAAKALELAAAAGVPPALSQRAYLPLVRGLVAAGRAEELGPAGLEWAELAPDNPDPWALCAQHWVRVGDWPRAAQAAARFFDLHRRLAGGELAPSGEAPVVSAKLAPRTWVLWLVAAVNLGDLAPVEEELARLLSGPEGQATQAAILREARALDVEGPVRRVLGGVLAAEHGGHREPDQE